LDYLTAYKTILLGQGMIAGYMGASGTFDDASGKFAMEWADQTSSTTSDV